MQSLRPADRGRSQSYFNQDTIAAMATQAGGPIAVLRVSGSQVVHLIEQFFSVNGELKDRYFYKNSLKDKKGRLIDEILWVYFRNPHSYTGEDVLELHLHGNAVIVEKALELLKDAGVRQALPGEFSFRAVKNEKLQLSQAQAVSELISASNEEALDLALEKLSGSQVKCLHEIADQLRRLAMMGEVAIDFSDQDLDELSLDRLKTEVRGCEQKLQQLLDSFDRGRMINDGIRLAIVGRPNAGKSSLFNALLGEDRSIVTDVAGTTRDIVSERLLLQDHEGGFTFSLQDTAGLRDSSDSIEQLGVTRSYQAAENADLILFCHPADLSFEESAPSFQSFLNQFGKAKLLLVLTKQDLSSRAFAQNVPCSIVSTSSKQGDGMRQLSDTMVCWARKQTARKKGEVLLTRLEHGHAVKDALSHLARAHLTEENDLFASDLRQALLALEPLIGTTVSDDLLHRIFSEFCIGK